MGLLSKLEQLIRQQGSAAILRERLEAFRDDVKRLEQKNKELEANNVELKKQNAEFVLHFEQNQRATEFTEHRGALFKRTPKGEFSETPYCPTCKRAVISPADRKHCCLH
jgi:uncharacterized protein (DUF2164 family)